MTYEEKIALLTNPEKYKDLIFWFLIEWESTGDRIWLGSIPRSSYINDHITQMPVFDEKLGELDYSTTFKFFNGTGININSLSNISGRVYIFLGDNSLDIHYSPNIVSSLFNGSISSIKKIGTNEYEISASAYSGNLLSSPVDTTVVRNGTTIKSPFAIGIPNNVTPEIVQVSGSYVTYKYSKYNALGNPSVRENGVSKAVYSYNNASGEFTLGSKPVGLITCDPVIDLTQTAESSINNIISAASAGFASFDGVSSSQKNAYIGSFTQSSKEITYKDLLLKIARSIHVYITSINGFNILVSTLSDSNSSDFEITDNDIVYDSLKTLEVLPPKSKITVSYGENYTVQNSSNLSATLSDANTLKYSTGVKIVSGENTLPSGVKEFAEENNISGSVSVDTLLIYESSANAELNYWLNRMNRTRFIYSMEIGLRAYAINVGKRVKLTLSEFNNVPKYGDVVRIIRDTSGFTSTIEVLI